MIDVKSIGTDNLRQLVDETEKNLEELKQELDRRQDQARHGEIEKLEDHLKNAEISLKTITTFLTEVLSELRGKKA